MSKKHSMIVYFDHYEHPSTRLRKKEIRYHRRYLKTEALVRRAMPSCYNIWGKIRTELRNESIKAIKRLGKKG